MQLAIPAGAEEDCDRFYVDLLGFVVQHRPATFDGRGGRWYQRGGVALHLGVDSDFHPASKAHPALNIDDYDSVVAHLRDQGVDAVDRYDIVGVARCHAKDPVGNRIELIDATNFQ